MRRRIDAGMASFFDAELSSSLMQRRSRMARHDRHMQPTLMRQQERQEGELAPPSPCFDAYVVLDFEATCERGRRLVEPEIIEFPMVLVDARSRCIQAEFQRYVRPLVHPVLSEFCTELTGITQSMVDGAETFPSVWEAALEFLRGGGYGEAPPQRSFLFVTCGDWDLKTMLPSQLQTAAKAGVTLAAPSSFRRWCNLKEFMRGTGLTTACGIRDLPDMLAAVNRPLVGRHHSGIDDCRNIASVLQELLRWGYAVAPTADHSGLPRWVSSLPDTRGPTDSRLHEEEGSPTSVCGEKCASNRHAGKKRGPRTTQVVEMAGRPHVDILLEEDPLPALLNGNAVLEEAKKVAYSKALARILRHAADAMRIPVSSGGYVRVEDILRCKPFCDDPAALSRIALVVYTNDKQRFKLAYDLNHQLYIRANQGHSLGGIDPELQRITRAAEVPMAIHGTYYSAWKAICACGYLSTMSRQHIHFARGLPSGPGVISGMRYSVEVLLYLDVAKVIADGVELWESANGVLLTPGVGTTKRLPLAYIAKVVDRKTGQLLTH
ncbi:2'-phosphotransferase [Trypanosoma rangeli SC58]|uniref:2'-phosphotransferase n=1 Tax=Trypanosoma rangeli SC58 TaxID=429131 RepID=A0A061J459_TRYRA|nr:phosphotransferase [Trypanosoma rangeli SC58]ESL09090.1 2'-phosphotransferase [Trypanosoma rangeli SC58]